jgi:opacity protein-like surface antigen
MNLNFPLERKFVIPAKAGIQMINKPCKAGQNKSVDRSAKYYFLLDTGLRRYDGANRKSRMKILLAFVLLFILSNAAIALEPRRGWLVDISGGYTPSILNIDSGISRAGYIGYKFNRVLSVEGGYTLLLNQATAGAGTFVTLGGPEIAGLVRFSINDRVSPFLRLGYTKMALKNATSSVVTSIENVYGPSYGAGLQFYQTDHLSLRLGYNAYNLQTSNDYNVQAGIPVNTSNAYFAILVEF